MSPSSQHGIARKPLAGTTSSERDTPGHEIASTTNMSDLDLERNVETGTGTHASTHTHPDSEARDLISPLISPLKTGSGSANDTAAGTPLPDRTHRSSEVSMVTNANSGSATGSRNGITGNGRQSRQSEVSKDSVEQSR